MMPSGTVLTLIYYDYHQAGLTIDEIDDIFDDSL